jgi:hypothetical protein
MRVTVQRVINQRLLRVLRVVQLAYFKQILEPRGETEYMVAVAAAEARHFLMIPKQTLRLSRVGVEEVELVF